MKMEVMDEEPPDLVEVSGQKHTKKDDAISGLEPQIEDHGFSKVPLTIVTGKPRCHRKSESRV